MSDIDDQFKQALISLAVLGPTLVTLVDTIKALTNKQPDINLTPSSSLIETASQISETETDVVLSPQELEDLVGVVKEKFSNTFFLSYAKQDIQSLTWAWFVGT